MSGALIAGRISAMQQALQRSSLVPSGFVVESAHLAERFPDASIADTGVV
jgi:hypothetical protein